MKTLHQIPSVELQTLFFVQTARALKLRSTETLVHDGFEVTLGLVTDTMFDGDTLSEAIIIYKVLVPEDRRRRGWFTFYIEFCKLLTHDAVLVCNVTSQAINELLFRRDFCWTADNIYIFRKSQT
jgi:hypothetical protein